MKTSTIRQSVTFKASLHEVYEALMDSKKHSKFTGSNAKISRKIGGRFSVWDGDLEGTNLELAPDRKIVQSWRASDWPEGHYSKAAFSLYEMHMRPQDDARFSHIFCQQQHVRGRSRGYRNPPPIGRRQKGNSISSQ